MKKDNELQKIRKERDYLSRQLEEVSKELARLDLLNFTLTQQKRQVLSAFNLIKLLEERVHQVSTLEDLYRVVVSTLVSELFVDGAALVRVDLKVGELLVLESAGFQVEKKVLKIGEGISHKELLEPTFVNSDSFLKPLHRFLKESFRFPFFVWSPVLETGEGLVLFVGNRVENLMEKQPFSAESLEMFEAIASVTSLRRDNILKTQQMLQEREERIEFLADIIKNSPLGILATDKNWRITYVNSAGENLYGWRAHELMGRDFSILSSQPNFAEVQREILDTVRGGRIWRGELTSRNKEGDLFYVDSAFYQVLDRGGDFLALVVFQEDISERKQMEAELRESDQKYHLVVENANQGIVVAQDGRLKFCNSKISEMMGYSFQELMSKPFIEFVHPEDQTKVLENYLKRLQGRELPKVYTFRAIDKWGSTKWLEINATRIQWEGRPATLNFLSDVTERVRMEEEIRRKEEYFRSLIENSTDVIFILDKGGIIRYTSPSSLKVLGYLPEELLEERGFKYIHPDDASSVKGVIQRVAEEPDTTLGMEFRLRHRDGSWRMMEGFARNLLRVPSIQGIVINARDITEQRAAEQEIDSLQEQFRQSQKMEAIGRLAGGIAHDFNNLLSIIQGYSDLSVLTLSEGDPLRENIEQIQKASRKAADLTRQLLAFSRRQVMEMRVLDLNLLLKNLEKMLRRLIGEDIELSILQGEGLGRVKADPGQLEQVILNLVVNARDAMPSGGKLTIETANVKLDEAYARAHVAVKTGDYVLLSISDTGEGMTPEVRERIFEPFFTTKQKGTGLGLSTVYGIVKQSGGNIWVYSEPGRGTSFKIYLPRVDEPLEETSVVIGEEDLPRGNETVLIVEDEEEVRKIAMAILRRQGYKVLEAPQGGDAFLICEKYEGPIHLMLTDVVMPRMDGMELAQRLLSMRPEMKVIYMSGYADNAILRHGFLEEGVDYIQKPFTVSRLARKVREVLDKDKKN